MSRCSTPSALFLSLTLGCLLPAPHQIVAQTPAAAMRMIDLTGAPAATVREGFTALGAVHQLPDRRVIVVDPGERKVYLVELANDRVTPLGRSGDGPGEYRVPAALLPAQEGGVWLVDRTKLHHISADGRMGRQIDLIGNVGNSISTLPAAAIDRTGRLYFRTLRDVRDSSVILRWMPGRSVADTAGLVPRDGRIFGTVRSDGTMQFDPASNRPFGPSPAWLVLADGRLAVLNARPYRLDIISGGQVTRGPEIAYQPVPVTAADRRAYNAARQGQRTVTAGSAPRNAGPRPAPSIRDEDFAPTKAPFPGPRSVLLSPQGEIWVERSQPAGDTTPSYDILSVAGRSVGRVDLRAHSRILGFGVGTIYVDREDPDDGVHYLDCYRWSAPAGP